MAETGLASERARDRTEQLQARPAALDELVESGTLEGFTGTTSLDRELGQIGASQVVEADLARLRGELEAGREARQLEHGAQRCSRVSSARAGTRSTTG